MPDSLLAIEIGGTKLQIVRGTRLGIILERHRFAVDSKSGAAGIRAQIEPALLNMVNAASVEGVGVGFGGPVDRVRGRIACSHQVAGWSDFPIVEWLASLAKAAVRIDNDANVAALGEAIAGAGKGKDPVFYVTLGSGVGGGLVVNRKIYHGVGPGEAEIGHLRLDRTGSVVEECCAGWAVDRKIRAAAQENPQSSLARRVDASGQNGGEARHLAASLLDGDPMARNILKELGENLAFALSHVTHLFHPEAIVLGGGLSLVGEPLRVAVAARLPGFLMEVFRPGPVIALAQLGEDAVPVGALILAGLDPNI